MKKTEYLWRVFFPVKCPLCKRTLRINEDFCFCCGSEEVRLSKECCDKCGKEKELCSCTSDYSPSLPHITGVFFYDGLIQNKLLSFKFSGRKDLHKFFGDSLAERVATAYANVDFDMVTFVPSSSSALKERGYNPAELITERTAKKLFLPCEELLLKKTETRKQHTLSAKERMTNIKGSVSTNKNFLIKGKVILLCDDIKTTGATLKECSDMLLQAGAKDVYCAVVAITSNLNDFDLDNKAKNK